MNHGYSLCLYNSTPPSTVQNVGNYNHEQELKQIIRSIFFFFFYF